MLGLIVGAFALGLAGVMDILWREIEPSYWYISFKVGLLLSLVASPSYLPMAPTLVFQAVQGVSIILLTVILYRLCLLGGSDVAALLTITAFTPFSLATPLSPATASLLLSAPFLVVYLLWSYYRSRGVIVRGEDLVEGGKFKWWLPKSVNPGDSLELDDGCRLEFDPPAILALSRGASGVEPGIPLVFFIALGYIAFIILELLVVFRGV